MRSDDFRRTSGTPCASRLNVVGIVRVDEKEGSVHFEDIGMAYNKKINICIPHKTSLEADKEDWGRGD